MDKFFDNFYNYAKFGPAIQSRPVPEEVIARYQGKLPNALLEYWREYGWCGWGKGILWLVNPEEWQPVVESWIGNSELLQQDDYHVIARSAFGNMYLWGKRSGQSLRILSTYGMVFPADRTEVMKQRGEDLQMRLFFSSSSLEEYDENDAHAQPLFERALQKLGPLDHDSLYGFEPALVLGGPCKLENLKKLNAFAHLDILAGMTDCQLMMDITKVGK